MGKILIYLIFIGFLGTSCSLFKKTYYNLIEVPATFKDGDTFASKLSQIIDDNSHVHLETPMVQTTLEQNSHIEDWRDIKDGSKIRLFINKDFIDENKWNKYAQENGLDKKEIPLEVNRFFFHQKAEISTGAVKISNLKSKENLALYYKKFSYGYSNKLNKNFFYNIALSISIFSNLRHSAATGSTNHKEPLTGFSLAIGSRFNERVDYGFSYDRLNYFTISNRTETQISLLPKKINRIGTFSQIWLNNWITLPIKVSTLIGEISGLEFGIGSNFYLSKSQKYYLNLFYNNSELKVKSDKEHSSATNLALAIRF